MPADPRELYSSVLIKKDGSNLSDSAMEKIRSIRVECALHLPDMMTIVFQDASDLGGTDPLNLSLTDQDILPIGAEVEILMGMRESPATVFKGEVTAQELELEGEQPPLLIVRGYDKRHRLQRGRITKTFLNVKDSDVVRQIASEASLSATVEETQQVYTYLLQNNQTNWEYLQMLAARNGYETGVDGSTLYFRKPTTDAAPVVEAKLWLNVVRLSARLTSAGQVQDVSVRGWDPKEKKALVGAGTRSDAPHWVPDSLRSAINAAPAKFGGGGKMLITDHPVVSQAEADSVAKTAMSDMAGNSVLVDAELSGDPVLKPGKKIKLSSLGTRFSGEYFLSTVTHKIDHQHRYLTQITAGGHRSNTLLELVSANGAAHAEHGLAGSVVIGIVTNNKDTEGKQGRVKVKFPTLGDHIESNWARIAVPSAGGTRGMYWLPEVNDEVLVAFEHGDVTQPYIIGALWNGVDAPPKTADQAVGGDGKVNLRILQSRTGHVLTMDDTEGKEKVTIITKGGHTVEMDDGSSPHILVKTNGGHQIKMDDAAKKVTVADLSGSNTIVIETTSNKITVQAAGDLELSATNNVTIKGLKVSIQAETDAELSGLQTKVSGQAQVEVSGAQASVKGEAMVQIQGAMVQLN